MQTILPATAISRWLTRCRGWVEPGPLRRSCELPRRGVLTLTFPGGGRIGCSAGRVWITSGGSREDIVLTAGQSHGFSCGDRVVVEALEAAAVEIVGC